jgi:hypothetical protein
MDPDPDPDSDPAIFVIDLQDASKKLIFCKKFPAYYYLNVNLHHFSEIKVKKSKKIVGISGSGSGIRIRNTGTHHLVPF